MKWLTLTVFICFAIACSIGARRSQSDQVQQILDELYQRAAQGAEVQYSYCRLTSDELQATAQATASSVLQGVCNPQHIEIRFHDLETRLGAHITALQSAVVNLRDVISSQEEQLRKQHRRLLSSIMTFQQSMQKPTEAPPAENQGGLLSSIVKETLHRRQGPARIQQQIGPLVESTLVEDNREEEEEIEDNSSEEASYGERHVEPRDDDVQRWNSTIHMEGNNRVFTFYWKIRHMDEKMFTWATRRSVRSYNFYVFPGGYRMYLRAYPRQSGDTVYLHVGLTPGEYDDQLPWPFKLKHKITVIDRTESSPQDLSSRIWDPTQLCSGWNWRRPVGVDNYECVGLGFPQELLRSKPGYLRGGDLLIRLTVYLHGSE